MPESLVAIGQWLTMLIPPLLIVTGLLFFVAGTIGLLRFPDVFSRLHAVTKADNLGLGLIGAGLAWQSGSLIAAVKILLIWLLALVASAVSCHLIARYAGQHGDTPR